VDDEHRNRRKRIPTAFAVVSIVLVALAATACSSGSKTTDASGPGSGSPAADSTAANSTAANSLTANATPTDTGSGGGSNATGSATTGVTLSGAYSGTMKIMTCVGSGPTTTVSVTMVFDGVTSTNDTGNISSTEVGWQGPDNTDYDSGFLNRPLDADGKGFVLDGITVKNDNGKVVTLHGTLRCP
jgi:hypothetical protein